MIPHCIRYAIVLEEVLGYLELLLLLFLEQLQLPQLLLTEVVLIVEGLRLLISAQQNRPY